MSYGPYLIGTYIYDSVTNRFSRRYLVANYNDYVSLTTAVETASHFYFSYDDPAIMSSNRSDGRAPITVYSYNDNNSNVVDDKNYLGVMSNGLGVLTRPILSDSGNNLIWEIFKRSDGSNPTLVRDFDINSEFYLSSTSKPENRWLSNTPFITYSGSAPNQNVPQRPISVVSIRNNYIFVNDRQFIFYLIDPYAEQRRY